MPISPPTKITVPFATSGLKNAIPANTNNITGNAGYDLGFGSINMTPKTAGGIPPFGQDFNGIFFDVTTAIQFLEAGGSFAYDSAFATAIGGYPLGAIVSRTDGTGLWRNTVANNATNPETFGAGWQPEDAGITTVAMTNANVTLTALQAARSIIIITGTITANINLILPTYTKNWTVVNSGTGAFTVTVKTAAGSGIALASGATQTVYGDGTNIVISGSGKLIGVQVFNTAGTFTYTPTPGTNSIIPEVQGAGAASGGAPATGAGVSSIGGPGGAGAYAKGRFTSGFAGASVVVGAGGTGVLGAAGNNGGSSSLGALISAPGGIGGITAGPSSAVYEAASNNTAAPSGGNITSAVGPRGQLTFSTAPTAVFLGLPGASMMGLAAGGGGPGNANTPSLAAKTGLSGADGKVIIWEYA